MGQEEKMARLEMFVDKLIANYSELKKEHIDLQNRFRELQRENKENLDSVASLQDDRNVMHARVSGMLDRIEEWESTLAAGREPLSFVGDQGEEEEATASKKTFRLGVE